MADKDQLSDTRERARTLTDDQWAFRFQQQNAAELDGYGYVPWPTRYLLAYVRDLAAGLISFEIAVLRGDHDGKWGAAIGVAVETLQCRGLYNTPLGRAVLRAVQGGDRPA